MSGSPSLPFSALRVVEAVVRHRNYSWAARELEITHSAVSQAVKRLETLLNTKLFERRGGGMQPSPAAVDLASAYATAALDLHRSLQDVLSASAPAKN